MKKKSELLKAFKRMDAMTWILFIIIAVYTISMIGVLGFCALNSVKDWLDFEMGNVFGLPRAEYGGWKFSNYAEVFKSFRVQIREIGAMARYIYVEEMFLNSLVYALSMSFFTIMTQVVVAYATAKYDFKLKNLIYNTAIIVMLVPIVGSLPSQMNMMETLGLKGSILGVCIMSCTYPGIYFLIFYAMFKSVPWAYAEAAQMDGAGHFTIFVRIMLPLVSKTILSVFILRFIAFWNDYYTPMLYVPNKPTIAYSLFMFQYSSDPTVHIPQKLCACVLASIPILILFAIMGKKITGNLTSGGIKG